MSAELPQTRLPSYRTFRTTRHRFRHLWHDIIGAFRWGLLRKLSPPNWHPSIISLSSLASSAYHPWPCHHPTIPATPASRGPCSAAPAQRQAPRAFDLAPFHFGTCAAGGARSHPPPGSQQPTPCVASTDPHVVSSPMHDTSRGPCSAAPAQRQAPRAFDLAPFHFGTCAAGGARSPPSSRLPATYPACSLHRTPMLFPLLCTTPVGTCSVPPNLMNSVVAGAVVPKVTTVKTYCLSRCFL